MPFHTLNCTEQSYGLTWCVNWALHLASKMQVVFCCMVQKILVRAHLLEDEQMPLHCFQCYFLSQRPLHMWLCPHVPTSPVAIAPPNVNTSLEQLSAFTLSSVVCKRSELPPRSFPAMSFQQEATDGYSPLGRVFLQSRWAKQTPPHNLGDPHFFITHSLQSIWALGVKTFQNTQGKGERQWFHCKPLE